MHTCLLTRGPRFDSRLGHKELWIYLALVCLVKITGKVSGEGNVQSITIVIVNCNRLNVALPAYFTSNIHEAYQPQINA